MKFLCINKNGEGMVTYRCVIEAKNIEDAHKRFDEVWNRNHSHLPENLSVSELTK